MPAPKSPPQPSCFVWLVNLEQWSIVACCLGLAGLMIAQILLRHVLLAPFLGMEEIAVLLGLWLYFLGMVHVTRTEQHISSGVVQLFVQRRSVLRALDIFKLTLCAASSTAFSGYALTYCLTTYRSGRTSTYMAWPTTLWVSAMAVGFCISAAIFYVQLYRLIVTRETASQAADGPDQAARHAVSGP